MPHAGLLHILGLQLMIMSSYAMFLAISDLAGFGCPEGTYLPSQTRPS